MKSVILQTYPYAKHSENAKSLAGMIFTGEDMVKILVKIPHCVFYHLTVCFRIRCSNERIFALEHIWQTEYFSQYSINIINNFQTYKRNSGQIE